MSQSSRLVLSPLRQNHPSPRCPFSANHQPFMRAFSNSSQQSYPRDMNRNRGVSPMRKSSLRKKLLSVQNWPLPKPNLEAYTLQPETDPNHGLWAFFNEQKDRVPDPALEMAYGRPWTVGELRTKSWEDLHALHWVCMKEVNRLLTAVEEHHRLNLGLGTLDFKEKVSHIRRTQKNIRWVLTERWYAWEEARKLATNDPTVDLAAEEGGAYRPELAEDEGLFQDEPGTTTERDRTVKI